jgi:mannose-6-phosphate isomerase class I
MYTPIEVRVNQSATSFFKRQRMTVNINEKDLTKYNKKEVINKIVEMYDKIPYNSDIIDNSIIQYVTIKSSEFGKYLKE